MTSPTGVIGAAWEVQQKLAHAGFRFCFIGGLALQRWGEPRYTQDVDLTLLCPYGEELSAARRLAELFQPRFDGAVEFNVEAIVTRRGSSLDWELIERELKPLLAVQGGQPASDRLSQMRHDIS